MLRIVLFVALAVWAWSLFSSDRGGTAIPYTTFRAQLEAGNVSRVTITGNRVEGELDEARQLTTSEGGTQEYARFVTHIPAFGDEGLMQTLREQGVEVQVRPESELSFPALLMGLLPFLLLAGLFYFMYRRAQGQGQGMFGMTKSRAKLYDRSTEETTFSDVAGLEGPKEELKEIIEYLRDPSKFEALGGEIPRGVLLVGSPGTGKTLMARAVAGEADVPFFSITGSDFMEMFVGVGASRVRNMFEEAKKSSPSIIFIDELDSIGRTRGAGLGGGHDEREQTLNQLLSEMDGFEPNESVIVMAATNRPDILDKALLRPGRFDRQVTVPMPSVQEREEILRIHARNKEIAEDVDLERVARSTPGFSGADLENLLNEAALLAAREEKEAVDRESLELARDKVMMGLKREGMVLEEEEKRLLAYHEGGHAALAALMPEAEPLHKVTIIPRGKAMGVTQQLPEKERYIYEKDYMLDRIAVMLGGRASEQTFLDTASSGAQDDLRQATKLARRMVRAWGMSEEVGLMAPDGSEDQVFLGQEMARPRRYSDQTAREMDQAVRGILDEAFQRAVDLLEEYRQGVEELASELMEQEELTGERVLEILGVEKEEAEPELPGEDEGSDEEPEEDGELD
ncbi:MAG: ATP-dependent zinc metalloprotease FtsH [bacterium]